MPSFVQPNELTQLALSGTIWTILEPSDDAKQAIGHRRNLPWPACLRTVDRHRERCEDAAQGSAEASNQSLGGEPLGLSAPTSNKRISLFGGETTMPVDHCVCVSLFQRCLSLITA
jgi:hypothetical protein